MQAIIADNYTAVTKWNHWTDLEGTWNCQSVRHVVDKQVNIFDLLNSLCTGCPELKRPNHEASIHTQKRWTNFSRRFFFKREIYSRVKYNNFHWELVQRIRNVILNLAKFSETFVSLIRYHHIIVTDDTKLSLHLEKGYT